MCSLLLILTIVADNEHVQAFQELADEEDMQQETALRRSSRLMGGAGVPAEAADNDSVIDENGRMNSNNTHFTPFTLLSRPHRCSPGSWPSTYRSTSFIQHSIPQLFLRLSSPISQQQESTINLQGHFVIFVSGMGFKQHTGYLLFRASKLPLGHPYAGCVRSTWLGVVVKCVASTAHDRPLDMVVVSQGGGA